MPPPAHRAPPAPTGARRAAPRPIRRRLPYRRFLAPKRRLTSTELTYLTQIDHRTHAAQVAVEPFGRRIVGVARYAAAPCVPETADLAVVIADAWQGQGLGRVLVERLLGTARGGPVRTLTATVLAENAPARALLAAVGFRAVGGAGATVELERPVGPVADLPAAA